MAITTETRSSGIPAVGELAWGTHFCQFYQTRDDLVDSLVPYFRAGLVQNEQCLWVTSEPLRAADARALLEAAVPEFDVFDARGQIEILDHDEWYARNGTMTADEVLHGWLEREQRALAMGRAGLRLTGNTAWLEHDQWRDFDEYERKVNATFGGRQIIGLCSYHLGRCDAAGVLDVVENHAFALARRRGAWALLESASLKLAKGELRALNEQLEQRVLARTAELERALRVRDEFLSVASHELKTPIASLQLYVEGLARAQRRAALSPEEVSHRLGKAQEQCARLEALVNNLLDVSRAGSGRLPLALEDVDLAALARAATDRFAETARRAGCTVAVRADEPVRGRWDGTRLDQVLTNLLANAAKHAAGTPITVTVASDGETATLAVRDEGPGVPLRDQRRIFERFAQLAPERNAGGFGLGLWIVRQIVETLGGTIDVASRPGAGATFTVTLPLTPPPPASN